MTKLVVDELQTTLEQTFTYDLDKRATIHAVGLYLYMCNAPSGTFTLSVKSGATTLISQTFDSAEMKTDMSTTDNYLYMWKTLLFDDLIQLEKGTYTLELSSSGYTYSSTSYLAWIKEHENIFMNYTGTANNFTMYPRSFRIYERQL